MYKIFDRRTCGLSHQIKGPIIVNLTILQLKPVLANFTVVGPLIWWDNPQVRLSKILYTNNNDFHNLDRSQMCAGGCYVFRTSKPHSGTLCGVTGLCSDWYCCHILAEGRSSASLAPPHQALLAVSPTSEHGGKKTIHYLHIYTPHHPIPLYLHKNIKTYIYPHPLIHFLTYRRVENSY